MDSRAAGWEQSHSFSHHDFPLERLAAVQPRPSVSICLPARNEERTIGSILQALGPLRDAGLVAQLAVVDHSSDATAEIAGGFGAEVYDQEELAPELGPVLGKGDAMWRALRVLRGDVICFLDADSEQFGAHFALGLLGPLVCEPELAFVKGFYRRPFRAAGATMAEGGGRVTELIARPLLKRFYPELSAVRQPLAGEIAARRELLIDLPFVTGYGVDIALLIDAHAAVGLRRLAQVDLEVRQNDHQSLRDLGPMADAVLAAVSARLARDGRLQDGSDGAAIERPPMSELGRRAREHVLN